jgi:anaerobic selenocysteine-containing dehydrogenase
MPVTTRSSCPLDCPDSCSLTVEVEDGRVVSVEGDHRNPVTQGFICGKVRRLPEHLYGEHRLLDPLIRTGPKGVAIDAPGQFRRASWDEALELVARRLAEARQRHGGESILPLSYGGSNGFLTQDTVDARLWRRLGACRLDRALCAAPSSRAAEGLYGKMPGVAPEDYAESRLIVIWGANPSASGIHQVPYIRQAVAAGATLVVVDPRAIPLARQADLHLAIRPGTDLPVALAVVRHLFTHGGADPAFLSAHATGADELRRRAEPWTLERAAAEAGVEAAAIERLAELWAASSPAVVRCGYGPERNRNGGSATAAILSLPAVAGKFGVRGGGYTMSNGKSFKLNAESAVAAAQPATRSVNLNQIGRALLGEAPYDTGVPVRAVVVYNHNPAMTLPDQQRLLRGLAREDLFTVVIDPIRTDTCRWADVVLPASHFLEHAEVNRGYGSLVLHSVAAVAQPAGQARSNHQIFLDLIRRLGLDEPGDATTVDEFRRAVLASLPPERTRGDRLAAELAVDGVAFPDYGRRPVMFVDVQPATPDGKIHLCPAALDAEAPAGLYHYQPDPASARYPLALISPATSRTISSTFGQLDRGPQALALHPDDAAARGLADGAAVRVFNELGELFCPVQVSDRMRPGVAFLPKGLWSHRTATGATANALVPDSLADLGGGACFNDARVEVEASP